MAQLKVAIIGQSNFAAEVYKLLRQDGHKITGVFTIPDKNNREDPLGENFQENSVFRSAHFLSLSQSQSKSIVDERFWKNERNTTLQ